MSGSPPPHPADLRPSLRGGGGKRGGLQLRHPGPKAIHTALEFGKFALGRLDQMLELVAEFADASQAAVQQGGLVIAGQAAMAPDQIEERLVDPVGGAQIGEGGALGVLILALLSLIQRLTSRWINGQQEQSLPLQTWTQNNGTNKNPRRCRRGFEVWKLRSRRRCVRRFSS